MIRRREEGEQEDMDPRRERLHVLREHPPHRPVSGTAGPGGSASSNGMSEEERRLIARVQAGFPLVEEPYRQIGADLGLEEEQVIDMLGRLLAQGKIRRIGVVPNHYALGIHANGMVVWDVPDERVREVGQRMGARPEVTHCYQRPRHLPDWPYNLFCMVHGHSRAEVLALVERIAADLDLTEAPHQALFSTRMLKKSGVRLVE